MPDDTPPLRPADRAEVLHSLSYVLQYGRTASQRDRDDLIVRLAAQQVLEHLERSNYVLMQKPPARALRADYPATPPQGD